MLYRLVSPVKRSGSSNLQFAKRIPNDVRERLVGKTLHLPIGDQIVPIRITDRMSSIRVSLRTSDASTAKVRQAKAAAYVEEVFAALRANPTALLDDRVEAGLAAPVSLTNRQATALSASLYHSWANGEGRENKIALVHTPDGWVRDDDGDEWGEEEAGFAATVAYFDRLKDGGTVDDLERELGPLADRLLHEKGIHEVDRPSRQRLLIAIWTALKDAMEVRRRNASGDYTPDPNARRFPEWTPPDSEEGHHQRASGPKSATDVSLTGLVADWWAESEAAGMKPSTHESYRNTMSKLVAFLGHDNAAQVTPDDIVRFKNHRLTTPHPRTGQPASARTVKDTDLAGLKSVFGWAVRNRKLGSNPATGITIKLGKPKQVRQKGFTEEEVRALLSACASLDVGKDRPETYAAKRWIPWLLAYTGARVGEIAQLRKLDVQKTGDHWSISITPEAGTVKGNTQRLVPLHPHIIDLGFIDFVAAAPEGHLFLRPNRQSGDVLGPLKGVKNRVREFVRVYVPDRNVQPNHAWRHLFVTRSREAGLDQELRRMITGHSGEGVDEKVYGNPAGLYPEICKLPRFDF